MNWQDPAAIAGYIGVGASAVLGLILKARKVWVRDTRDISYDTEQTKWVEGLQSEIRQLRKEREDSFVQRLQDVRELAEARALNEFMKQEMTRMKTMIDGMEASMRILKAKLRSIDSTISTDLSPLTELPKEQ